MEIRETSSTGGQKGVKLERFDLIPVESLRLLAEHFGKGARKYDAHQWRNGYEWSKSYSAIMRHLGAFWAGIDYDTCSSTGFEGCSKVTAEGAEFLPLEDDTCYNHTGSHHMTAVAWHSFVLLEFVDRFPEHDDRYKIDHLEGFDVDHNQHAFDFTFGAPQQMLLPNTLSDKPVETINPLPQYPTRIPPDF